MDRDQVTPNEDGEKQKESVTPVKAEAQVNAKDDVQPS
jgi:hypothetical protein